MALGTELVAGLNWAVFWLAVVVFVVVEGLLLYAAIRFRRRTSADDSTQPRGNAHMGITWTIIPALITATVLFLAWQMMTADSRPNAEDAATVTYMVSVVAPEQAAHLPVAARPLMS
jgi:cytochrome c oxidase subunit 2